MPNADANPFSVLTAEERAELESQSKPRFFKRGKYLFRAGEPVKGVFYLTEGVVKITQSQGRRELTVRLACGNEWVGHRSVFTSETYRGSALAKENTKAIFVSEELLHHFFGVNRKFAYSLIRLIAHDLERVERLLRERQELNVPSRLISLFRTLDHKFGEQCAEGRRLSTKVTKVELGEMVGASQEAVSRQLSKWKKENLLRELDRRFVLSKNFLSRVTR